MSQLIPLINLAVFLILFISGQFRPTLHSNLAIGLPLLPFFLELYWLKKNEVALPAFRKLRAGGVMLLCGILMTYLTGLGLKMGLFPRSVHQVFLYPTLLGGLSHALRQWKFIVSKNQL